MRVLWFDISPLICYNYRVVAKEKDDNLNNCAESGVSVSDEERASLNVIVLPPAGPPVPKMKKGLSETLKIVKRCVDEWDIMDFIALGEEADPYELDIEDILPIAHKTKSCDELAKRIGEVFTLSYGNSFFATKRDLTGVATEILDAKNAKTKHSDNAAESTDVEDLQREVKRLSRRLVLIENERALDFRKFATLRKIFLEEPDMKRLRREIMLWADEYAVRQEEAEFRREESRSKKAAGIEDSVNTCMPKDLPASLKDAVAYEGEVEGMETIWYESVEPDGKRNKLYYLSVSSELAAVFNDFNRLEYNSNLRHKNYKHLFPIRRIDDPYDEEGSTTQDDIADIMEDSELSTARKREAALNEIAYQKLTMERKEILDRLLAELPEKQALYYYYHRYENMSLADIGRKFGIAREAVRTVVNKAKTKAANLMLNFLTATKETEEWARLERERVLKELDEHI